VNEFVAARLRESADLLAAQQDNPFRVLAYRRAAESIASLNHSVEELLTEGGVEALDRIPHVGKGIAAAIAEMATTGRWAYLQRLRGSAEPEDVFCAIPGVGPKLAKRLHEELNVATLEQLEAVLAGPESAAPKGVGERRLSMIRSGLRQLLDRMRPRRDALQEEPSIDILLDVDREYREKVALDVLPRIAPKRFNLKTAVGTFLMG
jgi:putative hydrolase